ncbi:unnamed protein product [Parascedosporium putredinis]|uniref:Uncharacterized protein n=1 Tax=Parascedosporium putredinis TaxID=1442378 RepID=A0A9P1H3B5_9PEZI|nr:unnamed protein product [Parascedosporium putredinis]CAI7995701.1 unnamed protein product [Parascedosporium putredinis]
MCSGQPNAVTPTHSTIQATLQLGPSSKLSAPNQGDRASVTATTLSTVTTRRPLPSPTTATLTAPPPLPTSSEDPPPGGLAADSGRVEQGKTGNGRLSVAQIAGLSAGLAAAFGIAILLICLARRRRKKDYPGVETGFFMKSDRLKAISRRFTVYPRGHDISAPIHGSPPTRFPMGQYAPTMTQSNSSSSPPMVEKISSPELIARGS